MTQRDPKIPDLVSKAQAAEILGVSHQAAQQMVDKGRLKGAKVGSTWVFRRAAVEAFRKPEATEQRSDRCPPECGQNWTRASDPFQHVSHCPDYRETA